MRVIPGALLIVAGSICLGAEIVAQATIYAHNRLGNPGGIGYLAAAFLTLSGVILLFVGLGSDRQP